MLAILLPLKKITRVFLAPESAARLRGPYNLLILMEPHIDKGVQKTSLNKTSIVLT